MTTISFLIEGIDCSSCISSIVETVKKISGVRNLTISAETGLADIVVDNGKVNSSDIIRVIESLGYRAKEAAIDDLAADFSRQKKDLLYRLGTAAFLSMQIMAASVALYSGYFDGMDVLSKKFFEIASFVLSTPVVFYCGWGFHVKAIKGIIHRTVTMDTLISAGTLAAYVYSTAGLFSGGEVYFDTAAMIITFILAGRTIEAYAKEKTSSVFDKFREFLKIKTFVIDAATGEEKEISASDISTGNIFIVHPFERIPCDAEVLKGATEVDESIMTGESLPVKKEMGTTVVGGTSNLWGKIECKALTSSENSYAAKIMALLRNSFLSKAPVQRLADRVVSFFVPAIIVIAIITFLSHYLSGKNAATALMSTVSVLIVACPCALGLATPLALNSAITSALKRGILFRNPETIEVLSMVDRVVFDKTGTLTEGSFAVSDVICADGVAGTGSIIESIIAKASALEQNIQHPLALSLSRYKNQEVTLKAEDIKYHPGKGVEGKIDGNNILLGNRILMEEKGIGVSDSINDQSINLLSSGKIIIYYAENFEVKALISFDDRLRSEAEDVCSFIRTLNLKTDMLTGDSAETAKRIADKLGLSSYEACLLPEMKLDIIRKFKSNGEHVLFVGDGINDTPSIMEADIGVAMNEPSQLAPLSADVVLMNNNLNGVKDAIMTGRKTMKIIKSNLFWAFIYNIIAIPFAAAGFFPPVLSAALMSISSVSVCLNSLRA
ncbi:MAG: cation-translocating P-type ATPase [Candidatus Schekmanbacteria bacterium]|nr:cation-translocating P-type ATPase [Candidatus Schekmanbacteria bacterium]